MATMELLRNKFSPLCYIMISRMSTPLAVMGVDLLLIIGQFIPELVNWQMEKIQSQRL